MEQQKKWYYAHKGEQVGPLDNPEVESLISLGKITPDTKVWSGEGDWKLAKETELGFLFKKPQANTPPPLAGGDVDNRFVWAVAAVPIVGVIIELMVGTSLFVFYIAINIALCVLDDKKLTKAGHKSPENWAAFLIPVYLWKRATLLEQKKHYFYAWCAAFVLSIVVGIGGHQANLEVSACAVVTEILEKQLFGAATCENVSIDEEVSSGFYRATATLDSGEDLRITIREQDNGKIMVRIPNQ